MVSASPDETTPPSTARLYLVGFMASGKTSVGSRLARLLERSFVDLDAVIEEKAGESVRAIFDHRGEQAFRDLEYQCLRQTEAVEHGVIATGGGAMVFERNREVIRRLGLSIWLDPGLETILARLARSVKSDRPLYLGEEQIRELYTRRLDTYRMADLRVTSPPEATAHTVAARIEHLLRERSCGI